jgi:hypothetical protein
MQVNIVNETELVPVDFRLEICQVLESYNVYKNEGTI